MFTLLYGAGLRFSETLALTTADIDSARLVLHIRDTRNRYDRIVQQIVGGEQHRRWPKLRRTGARTAHVTSKGT